MSDITSTLRTQEVAERVNAQYARTQGIAVQAPQAVFPDDRVELSSNAQRVVEGAADVNRANFRQEVMAEGSDALNRLTARLNRLLSVYGVTSEQTTVSGHRVVDVLRNELQRLVGTVEPPTIDNQVKQELNFIARQMEIRQDFFDGLDDSGTAASDMNASADTGSGGSSLSISFGETSLEWGAAGQSGALLAPPATPGTDESGNTVDISQVGGGVYHLSPSAATASAFDRNAGRFSDQNPAQTRPDLNQDGARNEADAAAALVVVHDDASRQAATGVAMFVADLAVPIAVRGAEATPSRPLSFEERDA